MTDEEIDNLITSTLNWTVNRTMLDGLRKLAKSAIAAEREAIAEHARHLAAHAHALFVEVAAKGDKINTAHATGMTEACAGVLHAIRKRNA